MCFSAEASFASSAVLSVAGIATLAQVKQRTQLPFAAFPLIFAIHQFIEGLLWLSQTHELSPWIFWLLSRGFPFIAYVVWPTLVPWAVLRMEHCPRRRTMLKSCLIAGCGLSLFYLYYILRGPVEVVFVNNSIHYEFYFSFWILSQWIYGYTIIMATLFSGRKIITVFGLGLIICYNIAKQFYVASYPSVFCHLAAWLSLIIYVEIRYGQRFLYASVTRSAQPGSGAEIELTKPE